MWVFSSCGFGGFDLLDCCLLVELLLIWLFVGDQVCLWELLRMFALLFCVWFALTMWILYFGLGFVCVLNDSLVIHGLFVDAIWFVYFVFSEFVVLLADWFTVLRLDVVYGLLLILCYNVGGFLWLRIIVRVCC